VSDEVEPRQRVARLARDAVEHIREVGGPVESFRGIAMHDTRKDEHFTNLGSFEPARDAILGLPDFRERFGEPEARRVALQFVYHFVEKLTEPAFDDAAFELTWSDLQAEVAEPDWTYLGLANLRNFDTTRDPAEFGDGVVIRGRNPDELSEMGFSRHVLSQMDADWFESRGPSSHVLLVEDRIAKQPDTAVLGNSPDLWPKAQRILGALRLSADGDVGMSRIWVHRQARFPLGSGGTALLLASANPGFGSVYQLTEAIADAVRVTYGALKQLEASGYGAGPGNLDLALGTFMGSFDRQSLSPQRLVDLITTLEALIGGTGSGEIAFRLAFRVAGLLGGSDAERASVFTEMKAYYDTRSRVVHGAQLKSKHQQHLINQGPLQTYVRRLLRGAVHLRTETDGSYSKRFFDEDLDAALLDRESREPLRRAMGLTDP
jgi:hypothetical protein